MEGGSIWSKIGTGVSSFFQSDLGKTAVATGAAMLIAGQQAKNQKDLINAANAQNSGQAVTATDAQKQAQANQTNSGTGASNSGTGSNNTVIIVVAVVLVLAIGGFMVYKMKK
jgi:hypothetical protein